MTIDQNTLRRLNKLWKDRHSHDTDTTAAELVEIRETISVGSGAMVSPAYIHLTHNAGQTIAVAGEAISWDTQHPLIDPVGFANPAEVATTDLPITTVVVPYDGYYGVKVELDWDSHTAGGTVEIHRTRNTNAVRVWPTDDDPGIWTSADGARFADIAVVPAIVGDELSVYVDHDTGAGKDLATAQVIFYKVESSTVVRPLYRAAVLTSGPLAYWRLDETSGTDAADIAGHASGPFDGTYVNTPTLDQSGLMADGSGSPSVDFNGTNEYVNWGDPSELEFTGTASFSVEAWANSDTAASDAYRIVAKMIGTDATHNDGWLLQALADGANLAFSFDRWDDTSHHSGSTGYIFDASTTYHIVGTYDGASIKLYVDGVIVSNNETVGPSLQALAVDGYIGVSEDELAALEVYFNGRIDEVAIYDRALDPDEILEHYNIGRGAFI